MKKAEITRKFDEIVEFSGISEFIDTPVKRYSSGMYARLGFSVAAHIDPEVLLVDEVLSVGDYHFQQKCFDKMREFVRRGTTLVFVSHNMAAVGSLCKTAVLLKHGVPVFQGDVAGAIQKYYSFYEEETSNDNIELVDVRLRTASGEERDVFEPGEGVVLEVKLKALQDLHNAHAAMHDPHRRRATDFRHCHQPADQQPSPGDEERQNRYRHLRSRHESAQRGVSGGL